ncbi:hypothetical protein E3T43_09025 [Cryobacterium sp. Hh7]|uniref:hypothetical protein n=1 Tax=Cryobacterium sp. Hh7 TaxID=1259159 RepID=UPI00106B922F|nr:hypothetical protein [Cryobacterium sp. Hh7]TFD56746.1 hypothetical protein E3T43_09025 [Cryobacterium sp. Hh7]
MTSLSLVHDYRGVAGSIPAPATLRVTDRAYVIESGVTTVEGQAADLLNAPGIIDAHHRRVPRRVVTAGSI